MFYFVLTDNSGTVRKKIAYIVFTVLLILGFIHDIKTVLLLD